MRRVLGWSGGIMILVACLAAANIRREARPIEVDWQLFRPSPPVVSMGTPGPATIARTIAAKGVVEPVHEVNVFARISGRVAEVRVAEATPVRRGDVLIKLDADAFRSRLDLARTRLATARTNRALAEAHLRDIEKDPTAATTPSNLTPVQPTVAYPGLPAPPVPGPSKLEAARSSAAGWEREQRSAETQLDAAEGELSHATIRAPIDGVVEELGVAVGDDLTASPMASLSPARSPGPTAGLMAKLIPGTSASVPRPESFAGPDRLICRILDPSRLRVRAWIDEADVGLVGSDQPTQVYLPDDPAVPVAGRIDRVAPRGQLNGDVVVYGAAVELAESDRHPRAGMRVNIEIEVARRDVAVAVPVQAVLHRKRRDLPSPRTSRVAPTDTSAADYVQAVFVLDGNHVRLRPIRTGVSDERRVEVISGLEAGDRLVIGPFRALDTLADGDPVRIETDAIDPVDLAHDATTSERGPTR